MCAIWSCALLLFFSTGYCLCKDLPSFLKVCSKNDPDIDSCFQAAAEALRPQLITGVPEYNIPSIEPLVMNELISEETGGLRLTATEVKAWGCSEYTLKRASIDLDKQVYELELDFDKLRIEAKYQVDGKVLLLPVKGEGPMQANVTNVRSKTVVQGELYEKDGATYVRFSSITVKTEMDGGQVKVENLFGGDKLINDVINETINKNFQVFLKELNPIIDRALSAAFKDISNQVVENFTYDQLFP